MGRLRVNPLIRLGSATTAFGWAAVLSLTAACGSRTTFTVQEGPPPPPECVQDKDCDGFGDRCFPVACVASKCKDLPPVDCDDKNVCTTDTCEPETGQCSHRSAVLDLDGDHHFAPLPGKKAGEPDSCGDDCDDTNSAAHPGGTEICDGVDNDCDGVVDNGASLVASGDAILISGGATLASTSSLAYGGGSGYLAAYSGEVSSTTSVYLVPVDRTGTHKIPARFTVGPADAFGGPLAWTGDRFGLAWTDRRDARSNVTNYEIYFNIVNPDGTKRNPDLRVTFANGFSISPTLAWTGNEFVVLWEDDGMTGHLGTNQIYGQRIDVNGALVGGNVHLIDDQGPGQTSPAIAAGQRTIGVVWMRGDASTHELMFSVFDYQLHPMGSPALITPRMASGVYPIIVHNQSQFVIAWFDPDTDPRTIYGAVRDELGAEIVAATPLTKTPGHARFPALLPYGDRTLVVWSDDRDNNDGYELYGKTVGTKLNALTQETRLTNAPKQSIDPILSFGPNGEAGVLFGDERSGSRQVYFTHLACASGPLPN
jgi:hypothetical protein